MKASVFVRRGLDHQEPDSSQVPFWAFVSVELLARAVLAKTNVALLADPSDGNNILFACGFPSTKSPKSAPSKTVFHRCTVICPAFTSEEYDTCMLWMNLRNEELHTGALPLESLGSSEWMPRFFQIAGILLQQVGKTLEEFVGAEHASSATLMIDALSAEHKKHAYAAIKEAKESFESLDVAARLQKLQDGAKSTKLLWGAQSIGYQIKCPACEGPALVSGDIVRSTIPHDDNGEFVQEDIRIPTRIQCFACALDLQGHAMLHAIGQGNQFTKLDCLDPKDYYGIEFDPDDYFDSSYMNC